MARQYTPAEVSQIIDQISEKYFPGDEQFKKVLHALVFSESSYDNRLAGDHGNSIGLLQANRALGRGIGHSIEQLEDPTYNLELAMKEIKPAYEHAKAKGLKDGDVAEYVSRVAQRPAKGNEQIPKRNYGVGVNGEGKIIKPNSGEVLGTEKVTPTSTPTVAPTATPTPTPLEFPDIYNTKVDNPHAYLPNENVQRYAKQIQQEYNNKNIFQKLFTPRPVFSAETAPEQKQDEVEDLNMGFIEKAIKTQDFGAKTFSFYGKGGHEGTDFRASPGTPVRGFQGWVVDFAGQGESYYGNKVVLRNPNTGESVEFAHLDDIGVTKGDIVGKNQVIATTGNSGTRPDGKPQQAHLHVNYYNKANKKDNLVIAAKQAEANFAMAPTFDSVLNKAKGIAKGIVNPKQVNAAEATPVGTPKKEQPNSQLRPEQDPNQPGAYYGKSQGSYQVKPGDTLTALARQYGTTVNDFARLNKIQNPNMIRAGQSLNVPATITEANKASGYTIRSGDTLTSIARSLGTTVNDLVRKNGIQNPNLIRAGAKLKV